MSTSLVARGTATAAGVVCTCTPPVTVDGFLILLNGKAVATAALSVAIEIQDANTGTWVAPTQVWGAASAGIANPVSVTNATAQIVSIPGNWGAIRVNIPSFGTSTGTFAATIQSYGD